MFSELSDYTVMLKAHACIVSAVSYFRRNCVKKYVHGKLIKVGRKLWLLATTLGYSIQLSLKAGNVSAGKCICWCFFCTKVDLMVFTQIIVQIKIFKIQKQSCYRNKQIEQNKQYFYISLYYRSEMLKRCFIYYLFRHIERRQSG